MRNTYKAYIVCRDLRNGNSGSPLKQDATLVEIIAANFNTAKRLCKERYGCSGRVGGHRACVLYGVYLENEAGALFEDYEGRGWGEILPGHADFVRSLPEA